MYYLEKWIYEKYISFTDIENLPVENVHDEPIEFFEIKETNLATVVRYYC